MQDASEWPCEVVPWLKQEFQQVVEQAENDRLPHALLLGGESHQGKTFFARAVANYLLCRAPQQGQVCGSCKGCHLTRAGSHPDLNIIEPVESRVIIVKVIRDLVNWANQTAQQGGKKIVIIKPAEAMNSAAANALLKCLEEPVANTIIMLISDRPGRLLPTIRSRCQRISVGNPNRKMAESYLLERLAEAEDIASLLDVSRGRPLKAMEMHSLGALEQRRVLHRVLQELWRGDLLAHEGAKQLVQAQPEQVLEMLYLWLIQMIKSAQIDDIKVSNNNKLNMLFNQIYEEVGLTGIYHFYDHLSDQWTVLQSASNPNKQLVVENVLVEFAALAPVSMK
jgi:DNA polymerase-3 subunit delta'